MRHLLPLLLLAAAPPAASPIVVELRGVESAAGHVHVDICPQARFATASCPWSADAPAAAGTVSVVVPGVPPGRYAAQAYHDRNGNGRVDSNLFGIPTERVGFSNDAPVRLGPPRFADAAFDHGAAEQRIAFSLRKLP